MRRTAEKEAVTHRRIAPRRRARVVLAAALAIGALPLGGCTGSGAGPAGPGTSSPGASTSVSASPSDAPTGLDALVGRLRASTGPQPDLGAALRRALPELPEGDLGADSGKVSELTASAVVSPDDGVAELTVSARYAWTGVTRRQVMARLRATTFRGVRPLRLAAAEEAAGSTARFPRTVLRFEPPGKRDELVQMLVTVSTVKVDYRALSEDAGAVARFRAVHGGWTRELVDLGEASRFAVSLDTDVPRKDRRVSLSASYPRPASGRGRAAAKAATRAVRNDLETQGLTVADVEFPFRTPLGPPDAGRITLEPDEPLSQLAVVVAYAPPTRNVLVSLVASAAPG